MITERTKGLLFARRCLFHSMTQRCLLDEIKLFHQFLVVTFPNVSEVVSIYRPGKLFQLPKCCLWKAVSLSFDIVGQFYFFTWSLTDQSSLKKLFTSKSFTLRRKVQPGKFNTFENTTFRIDVQEKKIPLRFFATGADGQQLDEKVLRDVFDDCIHRGQGC